MLQEEVRATGGVGDVGQLVGDGLERVRGRIGHPREVQRVAGRRRPGASGAEGGPRGWTGGEVRRAGTPGQRSGHGVKASG